MHRWIPVLAASLLLSACGAKSDLRKFATDLRDHADGAYSAQVAERGLRRIPETGVDGARPAPGAPTAAGPDAAKPSEFDAQTAAYQAASRDAATAAAYAAAYQAAASPPAASEPAPPPK